jgi:hypothetical protein
VAEAFGALLAQSEPIEIVISDDGSRDGTYELLRQLVASASPHDRHIIRLLPGTPNRGLATSLNRAVEASNGELLMICAGDDVSKPERAAVLAARFAASPETMLLASAAEELGAGTITTRTSWLPGGVDQDVDASALPSAGDAWVLGATAAVRRAVFDRFGPLDARVVQEDNVLPLRALALGRLGVLAAPLVAYRRVAGSLTARTRKPAEPDRDNVRDWAARTLPGREGVLAEIERLLHRLDAPAGSGIRPHFLRRAELERAHVAALRLLSRRASPGDVLRLVRGLLSPARAVRLRSAGALGLRLSPRLHARTLALYRKLG